MTSGQQSEEAGPDVAASDETTQTIPTKMVSLTSFLSTEIGRGLSVPSVIPSSPPQEDASATDVGHQDECAYLIAARNDGEMNQETWSRMISSIRELCGLMVETFFLDTISASDAPWQHTAIGVLIPHTIVPVFVQRMAIIAGDYGNRNIVFAPISPFATIIPDYMSKAKLEEQLQLEESQRYQTKFKMYLYICNDCGADHVTVAVDHGVLPMRFPCDENEECEGYAVSVGIYQGDQQRADYEWYRPEAINGKFGRNHDEHDHVIRGGLLLRPREDDEREEG